MKNKRLMTIALVLSLLWIAFVILLFTHNCPDYPKYDLPDDANELGDFLAGVFSPLAFLWLVVGYFLQASELNLTRKELIGQTSALTAQSQAAFKSVELEAESQRASKQRREDLAKPILRLLGSKPLSSDPNFLEVVINNAGGEISLVSGKCCGTDIISVDSWNRRESKTILIDTGGALLEDYFKDCSYHLELKYTDMFNQEQKKRYLFKQKKELLQEIEGEES